MCEVVSKNIALKNPLFKKKPLFSNMYTFLSHCFETTNYHCLHLMLQVKTLTQEDCVLIATNCDKELNRVLSKPHCSRSIVNTVATLSGTVVSH